MHRPQSMQFMELDLLSIPNIFAEYEEFRNNHSKMMSDKDMKTETEILMRYKSTMQNSNFDFLKKDQEVEVYANELEDFICLMIKTIEESKYIKSLKLRVSGDHQPENDDQSLTYFTFSKNWTIYLLDALLENSNFQILQNLEITSEQLKNDNYNEI